MPDLGKRLSQARTRLQDEIDQPPLEQIAGRAAALRRRRHALRAGAALTSVVAVGVLLVRPWAGDPVAEEVPPAGSPPAAGPVYADLGITINGLVEEAVDLPGAIADVEFADPDHGYLTTTERVFASTQDGGLTWQTHPLPRGTATDLFLLGDGTLALADGVNGYYSDDGGKTWRTPPSTDGPTQLLQLGQTGTILTKGPNYSDNGVIGAGEVTPSWVAARPTADGTWWVGGSTADGRPAVAATRDRGQSWVAQNLDAPKGSSVQVSVLGSHAYAIVVGADRAITAILYSADGGKTFTRTWTGGGHEPKTLAGEAVPLLDGRLLVTTAGQRWYVSSDDGASFAPADGSLPTVGAIRRTWAGYVAYDLFGPEPAGWVAFSSDGSTWRKLHVR